jgi:microcystin-dependent protein
MSNPYVAEIRLFAGTFAPTQWAFCDGRLLPISQYDVVFALIGTTYGGDGQTTFALPDLRSRVPIHWGQGQGLSPYSIGQSGGTENVTLTTAQLPAHTHVFNATSAAATSLNFGATMLPANTTSSLSVNFYVSTAGPPTYYSMYNKSVGTAGGSVPHNNIQPTAAMYYIFALYGVFPSRN